MRVVRGRCPSIMFAIALKSSFLQLSLFNMVYPNALRTLRQTRDWTILLIYSVNDLEHHLKPWTTNLPDHALPWLP